MDKKELFFRKLERLKKKSQRLKEKTLDTIEKAENKITTKENLKPDFMEGFNQVLGDETQELINTMFTPENIEMKTETPNPHAIAGLKAQANRCQDLGLTKTGITLNTYIQDLQEVMVSYQRKSRDEFVKMFQSIQSFEQNSIADKHNEGIQ